MAEPSNHDNNFGCTGLIIILIIVIFFFGIFGNSSSDNTHNSSYNNTSSTTSSETVNSNLKEQQMPANGTILSGLEGGISGIEITASNANAYVKVKASRGTLIAFFVRSGSTVRVSVPPGTYSIQFALGDTWYGTSNCFGSDTSYGQDKNVTLDSYEVMSYNLNRTTSGNFRMDSLSASEFQNR